MKIRTALLLGAALTLAPVAPALAQDAAAPDPDQVVATVNGTEITLGHMIVLRAQLPEQYQQLPPEVLFDGVLEQLINQEILAQQDEAVARAIELRLDNERRALQANEVITDFAATAVTEEAIQAAYDEAVAGAEAEQEFNAAHILVETEDEALALIEELNGGADFAALAKEHSTGPSGPNGGSLGWFGLGMMVPPFEAAVLELEPGAVSAPVETQFGWHVVKLNETRDKPAPTLEQMRDELAQGIETAAIEAEIARLSADAAIERADLEEMDRSVIGNLSILLD